VLNKARRADHWFWSRYSVHPYIGCQHGCEFCYCRERKYAPYDDLHDFAHVIKVKENAPDLLRRALGRLPADLLMTGDYQPAERKFRLSRKLLEVCYELGFPVFVLERSPLVLEDLDLIKAIHERTRAVVAFSAIYTPDSPDAQAVRQMERLAPAPEKRFAAMEAFAAAGIMTGTSFMPILPGLCDNDANLESVVRWTAEHGGQFVLAGGLTLADQQRAYFFEVLSKGFPALLESYAKLYPAGSYGQAGAGWQRTALKVRELCEKYGIRDRMPRPIIPGDKRSLNKRIVEALANRVYTMEVENAPSARVWAWRKAAWAVEDLEPEIGLVYRTMGLKGLESIQGVGTSMGREIEALIKTPSP
jgi:DNA repair photolyase